MYRKDGLPVVESVVGCHHIVVVLVGLDDLDRIANLITTRKLFDLYI